eukprot:6821581-Karenia_brevis.AAC.1
MCQHMAIYRKYTLEKFEQLRRKQADGNGTTSDRSTVRRLSDTWNTFFLAAAPGREAYERLMIMMGNSKFSHIFKAEPFIFPGTRWAEAIYKWGPEIFVST